ncbi:hypothetical protein D3C75_807350 [compost metagenome]
MTPVSFLRRDFTTHGNNAKRQNKYRHQIAVPREDSHQFRGFFEVGRMQGQQGIKVGRTVGLTKREIHRGYQTANCQQTFLEFRRAAPKQQQYAAKSHRIQNAKFITESEVNQQRLKEIKASPRIERNCAGRQGFFNR